MEKTYWWKKLQPLRIPPRWDCMWNKLERVEPSELEAEDKAWLGIFVEDMVYMRREYKGQTVSVDLGWYPDGDPAGAYTLVAVLDDNWQDPLLECTSRSTKEIVETMEYWLFEYIPSCQTIDEKSFRKRHPNRK